MNELRTRFGRPLRLAIVGGGRGAWIGEVHRTAAELGLSRRAFIDKLQKYGIR